MKPTLLFALLFALPAHAGPINWIKHHPVQTQIIFSGIAAGVAAEGLHQCRIQNVENCQAHYGAAWGAYGATVGLNLVGVLVGHNLGGKVGKSVAYGSSTIMLGWGAYQWHGGLNKPKEDNAKPNLGSVTLVRH